MPRSVGRSPRRKDGDDKVTGRAKYVDDLSFPGMLHATTIRSTIACGRIDRIRPAFDTAGYTLVDRHDIPGRNVVAAILDDQPCLAAHEVRHVAEPIMLVAHERREALLGVRVDIDYTPATPVFDPRWSPECFKSLAIEKGRLDEGFAEAYTVVEGEYRTGHQEQLYIETNGVIAVPDGDSMIVYGSLQCPYYVHRALKIALGLTDAQVGSCRPRPAAASAARRSTRPSSRATRRSSRARPAGP
jgi:CO/xanthine dehydrogenase Mo-binding subunit